MKFLLTGVAGFIGMHTAQRLLDHGHEVVGLDNLSDYYDPGLKRDRLERLQSSSGFCFYRQDIAAAEDMLKRVQVTRPDRVVHLAAQPGVRYSIEHPQPYISSNLVGFASILEACRHGGIEHLVYASSSSVYGNNARIPFSEHDAVDHPLSLYAATKRANELMAHSYSHLYGLPTTGLRFFTVYGPWGRPDMAPIKFAQAITSGEVIQLYNRGHHRRDFTYIDDIVSGVVAVAEADLAVMLARRSAEPVRAGSDPAHGNENFRLYNIGNSQPEELMEFLSLLEQALGKEARYEMAEAQPGDVLETWADCSDLERDFSYRPSTPLAQGVEQFARWFRDYYG